MISNKIKALPDDIVIKRSKLFATISYILWIIYIALLVGISLFIFASLTDSEHDEELYFALSFVCGILFEIILFIHVFFINPYDNAISKELNRRVNPEFVFIERFHKLKSLSKIELQSILRKSITILILSIALYFGCLIFSIWTWFFTQDNFKYNDIVFIFTLITFTITLILTFIISYYSLPYFLAVRRELKLGN